MHGIWICLDIQIGKHSYDLIFISINFGTCKNNSKYNNYLQDCSTCEFMKNVFKFISFLVSDPNACHCYADLKPFHCEEEEGVDLIQVMCLNKAQCSKIGKIMQ